MKKTAKPSAEGTRRKASRRDFIKKAVVAAGSAAAAAVGSPGVRRASAQTAVTLKMPSTWPSKEIFHEIFEDWAKKVHNMSGGRVKIDILPAGAVVPAFELIEAVSRGTSDGGRGVPADSPKSSNRYATGRRERGPGARRSWSKTIHTLVHEVVAASASSSLGSASVGA
ncbi:MAG TPA: twin-arginine translocation signal domain-containing protein [Alphaproteobacteria bacterium]|nr:twin-arginine translocation signal domain-containing protein [Alphaproteobacteria bacterium]